MIEFSAVLETADRGGALIVVPDEVVAELGGGGRIKVLAEFDGLPYQGSIATYAGRKVLGVLKSIREELGVGPGDEIQVRIEGDTAERTVGIPEELETAFDESPGARDAFAALSYSHQREHVNHINEGKQPETRLRRARRIVEMLG